AMDRGLSEKERQMMQAVIDDTYDQFVEAVLKGRQKSFRKLLETWEAKPPFEYPFTPDAVEIIQTYQRERKQFAAQDAPSFSAASPANATADETIENASEEDSHLSAPNSEMLFAFAKSIAEGKIYTGRQALKIGLVDQLGSLDDAIHLAAKLAGIRGEPTVIERKKREYGLLDFLTQGLASLTAKQVRSPIQYRFPY
ncbi:MAG: S49 family peptidase, partial [Candidatus Hinthialibacter sp.]